MFIKNVIIIALCSLLFNNKTIAFAPNDSLKQAIVDITMRDYYVREPVKRSFFSFRNKSIFFRLNPINYLGAGLLFIYQRIFSEQIQANCMYEISCSEYTKCSIDKNGIIKGSLLGIDQLSNCFPNVIYDYPRHLINENYKIINAIELDE
ncbi:MAG: hypothetical protein COC01_08545 [Bacteroidetes bacterium]|nr:MAG: hypothetical protein COC01_08545 [Bacteroidota bacterium]